MLTLDRKLYMQHLSERAWLVPVDLASSDLLHKHLALAGMRF